MFHDMKYLIIDSGDGLGLSLPILFHPMIEHAEMAARFQDREILGAGFVSFGERTSIVCYGESNSLQMKAKPEEDVGILSRYMKLEISFKLMPGNPDAVPKLEF